MALERLNVWLGLTHDQVMNFAEIARTRFLVENAFQLLAEDNLQPQVWRSYRHYARGDLLAIVEQAMAECSPRSAQNVSKTEVKRIVG